MRLGISVLLLVCIFPSISAAQSSTTAREPSYKCDTSGVRLEGTLIERTFYGPPGFGETPATDAKEKVLVLNLSQSITVAPIDDSGARDSVSLVTLKHIRQVQLFAFLNPDDGTKAHKLVGRRVTIVGTLSEAVAPSEHLKVSMEVESIIGN
jgi:hypothetical protein